MSSPPPVSLWRPALLALVLFGSLGFALSRTPIAQDPAYHDFADRRTLVGVPNFWNVTSNLPFFAVGLVGLELGRRRRLAGATAAWTVFFVGVMLVALGSGYYHWSPRDATLVWDRLPMTIGFMAMAVALVAESVSARLTRPLLPPALAAGLASVVWWDRTGDLRFYAWVQVAPLLTVLAVLALFRGRFSHRWMLLVALAGYLGAKLVEIRDRELFAWSGGLAGGHALKHLLAAATCLVVLEMLRRRRPLASGDAP